jgi:hypothetical protein
MKSSQFNSIMSLMLLIVANQSEQLHKPFATAWFSVCSLISLAVALVAMRDERAASVQADRPKEPK